MDETWGIRTRDPHLGKAIQHVLNCPSSTRSVRLRCSEACDRVTQDDSGPARTRSTVTQTVTRSRGLNLPERPRHPSPGIGMHRQQVDDVGPVVAMSVAVAEQSRGDRVTVVLVSNQDAAEGVAVEWVERLEERAEIDVKHQREQ